MSQAETVPLSRLATNRILPLSRSIKAMGRRKRTVGVTSWALGPGNVQERGKKTAASAIVEIQFAMERLVLQSSLPISLFTVCVSNGDDLDRRRSFSINDQVRKSTNWIVLRAMQVGGPTSRVFMNFVQAFHHGVLK